MSDFYCTISVENSNVPQIQTIIEDKVGENLFDISLEIEDRSEVYSYTSNFMEEHSLKENDPVLRGIDLTNFTTDIDLYCSSSCFGKSILDVVADSIGHIVSQTLDTRVLVTLTNQETPFCMFESGSRTVFSTEDNIRYFDNKFWVPKH